MSEVTPYVGAVASVLDAQCLRCHAEPAPAGGWNAQGYLGAIGCTANGAPVALPDSAGSAPLLRALARPDHAGYVTPDQAALLGSWVESGASRGGSTLHGTSFADPRSPTSHVAVLRAAHYAPMTDPSDPSACGTCHDGVVRPSGVDFSAPGAPSCTSCHTEPDGPFACGTCHGNGARAYPPRDRCFFPQDRADTTHAAHVEGSAIRATGLACTTCHPTPPAHTFGGAHTDGHVEVWFDYALAGKQATFDASESRCSGTCHDHGGARPKPAWGEGPVGCNDCHTSPPANHYSGACTMCHHEADATGTKLTNPVLHLNGKIDLGDGSGKCGACHGQGDSPWPQTGAHAAHANPKDAAPVACETCHDVPTGASKHPLGGGPVVRLSLLASAGARRPTYDPATKTCSGTYCHQSVGGNHTAPSWNDGAAASTCQSCHAVPPSPPHAAVTSCDGSGCHQGSTTGTTATGVGVAMTPAGRAQHVNGVITRGL